jgi:hypothetical protein
MKYSIHILTTHKHADRHQYILNTWLKGRDNYCFYTDKNTGIGNQVEVDPDDTYTSNGKKNLKELIRIEQEFLTDVYDWFFFCDDDTCPNLPAIEKLLPTLNPDKMYGSILEGTWPHDRLLKYHSGGAGYLISSKILKKYKAPSLNYLSMSYYSDVCVGMWAFDKGIQLENLKGFHSQPPEFYKYSDADCADKLTFHYIKTYDGMNKLWSSYE